MRQTVFLHVVLYVSVCLLHVHLYLLWSFLYPTVIMCVSLHACKWYICHTVLQLYVRVLGMQIFFIVEYGDLWYIPGGAAPEAALSCPVRLCPEAASSCPAAVTTGIRGEPHPAYARRLMVTALYDDYKLLYHSFLYYYSKAL